MKWAVIVAAAIGLMGCAAAPASAISISDFLKGASCVFVPLDPNKPDGPMVMTCAGTIGATQSGDKVTATSSWTVGGLSGNSSVTVTK